VPIAWGFVSSNGALGAHSPNVTGVVWDVSNSWFNITISGEDYFWTRYATVVTPSTGTATGSLAPAVGSVGGHLLVWLNNTSGGKVQDNFQFVTFR